MSDTIDNLRKGLMSEVNAELERIGQQAEDIQRQMANYKNHTGNLRRSVYHKVDSGTLEFGDSADYASKVSSKGYDVIDSGVSFIRKELGC